MELERGIGIRPNTNFWRGPDKHDYHVNKSMSGGRISMRCTQYYLERCRGRASVKPDGTGFRQTTAHSHDPDRYRIEARAFRHALMQRARSGDHTPFKKMFHQERRKLRISRHAAARLPLVSLRSSLRRARLESRPNIPHTLKDLDKVLRARHYKALSRTLDGKANIYAGRAGSASQKTISLIFFTKRMRRYMRRVHTIFCDATFSPVPRRLKAYQVWTISTVRLNHVIPLVRVLMRRRTANAYLAALNRIKELVPRFQPSVIMTDFESGEQRALRAAFPNATLHGCLFHYAKAVGGKARKLGMTKIIKRSPVVRGLVRRLCVIPLLPQDKIMKGFKVVARESIRKSVAMHMLPLLRYWDRTWRPKIHLLSVCGCPNRTSNASEVDNNMLQTSMPQKRPNVWDFMDGLLEIEDTTEQDIAVLNAARRASRARATSSVSNDNTIASLTEQLQGNHISVKRFLKTASYTIVNAMNKGLEGKKKKNRPK